MSIDPKSPPTDEEILATFVRLASAAMPVINGSLALAAVAYVIGWWQAKSYLAEFSAAWAVGLLSTSDLLARAAAPLTTLAVVLVLVTFVLGLTTNRARASSIVSLIGYALIFAGGAASFGPVKWNQLAHVAGLGWAIVTAALVYQLTLRAARESIQLNSAIAFSLFILISQGFFIGPQAYYAAEARRDRSLETSTLPCVTDPEAEQSTEWRLLVVASSQAILVSLRPDGEPPPIRVVAFNAISSVRMCEKSAQMPTSGH